MTARIPYALPAFGCLLLFLFYWRALNCWFIQDDLGWLHIGLEPQSGRLADMLKVLFAPRAQGTLRPWSESLYFWGLYRLFGINPLAFHIVAFTTTCGSLLLLFAVVRRLTGSAVAACSAQIFWLANPAVGASLCWSSAYNELQCVFFMVLALWLFMNGHYWAQTAIFILGLGSLETAVLYPFIAASYALLYDQQLRLTAPLFVVSATYVMLHFWIAPSPSTGAYSIRFDGRILSTLRNYVEMSLGPESFGHFHWTWPAWLISCATIVLCLGLIAGIATASRLGVFGAVWFVVFLAPFLLLPERVLELYLVGPVVGLAIILAGALASRWRTQAIALAAIYLAFALPASWDITTWHYQRSLLARDFVLNVVEFGRVHPGKTLLLTGMDVDQYNVAFVEVPFDLYGMKNVWLAPGADRAVKDDRWAPLLVPANAQSLLSAGEAILLDVSRQHAVNHSKSR